MTSFDDDGNPIKDTVASLKVGTLAGPETAYDFVSIDQVSGEEHEIIVTYGTDDLKFQGYNYLHLLVYIERMKEPEVFNDEIDFEVIFYRQLNDLAIDD